MPTPRCSGNRKSQHECRNPIAPLTFDQGAAVAYKKVGPYGGSLFRNATSQGGTFFGPSLPLPALFRPPRPAIMEAPPLPESTTESRAEGFAQTLREQRSRVEEFLTAHRQRVEQARIALAEQAERIGEELERNRSETAQTRQEIEKRSRDLDRRAEELEQLKQEFEARQADWEASRQKALEHYQAFSADVERRQEELGKRHEEFEKRRAEIDEAQAKLHHDQQALARAQQEHQADVDHVASLREQVEARLAELAEQRERLSADRARTESQRRRIAQEFRAQRAEHLREIQSLRAELSGRDVGKSEELERQFAQIHRERERLQQESAALHAEHDKLTQQQRELATKQAEIDEARSQLHHDQQAFGLAKQEHQAEVEHVATLRDQLEERIAELAEKREKLAADQARTEAQRRRIAQEFRDQRAAHLKELERRRAEISGLDSGQSGELELQLQAIADQRRQLERQVADLEAERERLAQKDEQLRLRRAEVDEAEARWHHDRQAFALAREEHQAEVEHVAELRRQLEERIGELAEQREQLATDRARTEAQRRRIAEEFKAQRASQLKELQRQRGEIERLETARLAEVGQELAELTGQRNDLARQVEDLQADRDRLSGRLAQAESESTSRRASADDLPTADDDLRRRYEMAIDDLREIKARNAELEKQLAGAPASSRSAAPAPGGVSDWEAEKARILAALESEFDESDAADQAERLKIEEVVQKTDRIIAEKNRQLAAKDDEIADLQRLLADQSSNLDGVAVGAAALGELLDQDAIIQEERENLRRLRAEWEEKLRQAEVDLSMERAKIARERAVVEEKLQAIQAASSPSEAQSESAHGADKPARGRWLARLGLKDAEDS